MKIGSYVPQGGKIENIEIFRPCQTILLKFNSSSSLGVRDFADLKARINVTLQNSKSGSLTTLIPFVEVSKLAEISTYNEGAICVEGSSMILPVMLNPIANILVDNDKYLDIDIIDIDAKFTSVEVYNFVLGVNSDFVAKYSKLAAPAGVARHRISTAENDLLCLPLTGFDEVQLTYKNGVVAVYSDVDLRYLMSQNNDITAFRMHSLSDSYGLHGVTALVIDADGKIVTTSSSGQLFPVYAGQPLPISGTANKTLPLRVSSDIFTSFAKSFILNLDDVETLEIIRDTDSSASFEYLMADFVPTVPKVAPQPVLSETPKK